MENILPGLWVLIPAYNPPDGLPAYVADLTRHGLGNILVVNDGSDPALDPVFKQMAELPGVTLMQHAANAGKGAAIKTGISYLASSVPGCRGVVTVDADGQHAVADAIAILHSIDAAPGVLALGCRNFDLPHVPLRSRIGNKLTCLVVRFCFGMKVSDTQTGLRGIGRENFPILLSIPFDRYEYEMEMLVRFSREGIPVHEIPIQTIYLNENRASKFNPFKDSLRVYGVILRAFLRGQGG